MGEEVVWELEIEWEEWELVLERMEAWSHTSLKLTNKRELEKIYENGGMIKTIQMI